MANAINKIGTQMRYTDAELGLIKATFAGKLDLMALFRKFLLDGKLTDTEMDMLHAFIPSEEALCVLEKAVRPELDKLAPAFQTVDLFSSLDFTPTPQDHALKIIQSRAYAYKYLKQRFDIFRGKKVEDKINFDDMVAVPLPGDDSDADEDLMFVKFLCRNMLLSHIDTQLFNSIMIIAGDKNESPDEQKRRLTLDSSK